MTFNELRTYIQAEFNKNGFHTESDQLLLSDAWKTNTADLVISYDSEEKFNFAVLVSTSSARDKSINATYAKKVVRQMTYDNNFWIGLVWNNGVLWILDPTLKSQPLKQWRKIEPEDLQNVSSDFLGSQINDNYKAELIDALEQHATESDVEQETVRVILNWVSELDEKAFLQRSRMVTVDLLSQFRLLRNILKSDKKPVSFRYCRYISMEGLQRILLNKKESMCGLAGMNDKSQGFFLDKCLSNSSFNLFRKPQKKIDEFNKAFILSLCDESKKDNLTMWRLYGRDGSGICLVYEANLDVLKNSPEFILLPVTYGSISNKIVLLFKILSKLHYINGLSFGLSHKYVWQYFVKPDEFKVEEEYRLLYIPTDIDNANVKWILNSAYSIFHPLCEFSSPLFKTNKEDMKYTSFPLVLKEVIFGPKCLESKTNKVQLRTYLSTAVSAPIMSESKIDFYR